MKYLKAYDTDAERSTDIINLPLPYVTYARDTEEIYADGGYISDGLVFQLDGIQKGPNANAWTDLVGGHVFTKNYYTVTSDDKSFIFAGTSRSWLKNTDTLDFNYNTCTIEVCYNATTTNSACTVFSPKANNNVFFGYFSTTKICNATSTASVANGEHVFQCNLYGKHTCGVNSSYGLVDTNFIRTSKASNYYSKNATYNIIGGREGNTQLFIGNIYAVRIYNRHLTLDEMRHNQQVDIKRFFN